MAINPPKKDERAQHYFRRAHVKIQSVTHAHFTNETNGMSATIGQEIDKLLKDEAAAGRFPNKLSLEIDPPEELSDHQME